MQILPLPRFILTFLTASSELSEAKLTSDCLRVFKWQLRSLDALLRHEGRQLPKLGDGSSSVVTAHKSTDPCRPVHHMGAHEQASRHMSREARKEFFVENLGHFRQARLFLVLKGSLACRKKSEYYE